MVGKSSVFPPGRGLIGVVHLQALPGSPRNVGSFAEVYGAALADGRALAEGGMDGLIVENFGDVPFFPERVEPHTTSALAIVARLLRVETGLPVGINCLRNDGVGALGAAAAAEVDFVRVNVLTGAAITDQGLVSGCAAELLRYRRALGVEIKVLADVLVKHAKPLGETDPVRLVRDTVERGLADGLVVTGPATGEAADLDVLGRVKSAAVDQPVFVGSGVSLANISDLQGLSDGLIVGTSLKNEGLVERPIDLDRVRALVAAAGRFET